MTSLRDTVWARVVQDAQQIILDCSQKMPTPGGCVNAARALLNKVALSPEQREANVIQACALLMTALEVSAVNTRLSPVPAPDAP